MTKPWPQHELKGLVTREIDGRSAIIPIWHEVTRHDVSDFSPTLADKLAVRTSDATATDIAPEILAEGSRPRLPRQEQITPEIRVPGDPKTGSTSHSLRGLDETEVSLVQISQTVN